VNVAHLLRDRACQFRMYCQPDLFKICWNTSIQSPNLPVITTPSNPASWTRSCQNYVRGRRVMSDPSGPVEPIVPIVPILPILLILPIVTNPYWPTQLSYHPLKFIQPPNGPMVTKPSNPVKRVRSCQNSVRGHRVISDPSGPIEPILPIMTIQPLLPIVTNPYGPTQMSYRPLKFLQSANGPVVPNTSNPANPPSGLDRAKTLFGAIASYPTHRGLSNLSYLSCLLRLSRGDEDIFRSTFGVSQLCKLRFSQAAPPR
jgi:hypothetical protein